MEMVRNRTYNPLIEGQQRHLLDYSWRLLPEQIHIFNLFYFVKRKRQYHLEMSYNLLLYPS